MRLQTVEITNIRAIDYLKFEAGALTIIRAHNGRGKTSAIEAVKAVFEGGHDPSLLRQGTKKGVVALTLDDGTSVEKVITPKSATLTVKTAEGQVVPAPATFVAQLAKGFAFDPLAFISAPKAERAKYIASAMPISIGLADILASVELKPLVERVKSELSDIGKDRLDMPGLLAFRKVVYDNRAAATRQRKTQEGGIDALRKTLPANWKPEGDADKLIAEAQAKLEEAKQKRAALIDARDSKVIELDRANDAELAAVSRWEADEIDRIRQEATARRSAITEAFKDVRHEAYHAFDDQIEEAQQVVSAEISNRDAAREVAKGWAVQAQTAATIAQYQKDLRETCAREETLTACLDAIDAAKEKAMEQTPIPEIMTIDGEVYYRQPGLDEPVPFDSVNTQQQWMLALKIASLGAGALGLMYVDGSEAIVGENFEKFRTACVESGFQVIVTRADEAYESIDVETVEPELAAQ